MKKAKRSGELEIMVSRSVVCCLSPMPACNDCEECECGGDWRPPISQEQCCGGGLQYKECKVGVVAE